MTWPPSTCKIYFLGDAHDHAVQLQLGAAAGRGRHHTVLPCSAWRRQASSMSIRESGLRHWFPDERGRRRAGDHHQTRPVSACMVTALLLEEEGRLHLRPAQAGLPRRGPDPDSAHRPAGRPAKHSIQPLQRGHPVGGQLVWLHGRGGQLGQPPTSRALSTPP